MFTPKFYTIVSGIGESRYPLVAFDNALRQAGIGDYNLVKVSSILPAGCTYSKKIDIEKGSIVFAAYASKTVTENQQEAVAVATAIPQIDTDSGVIFETSEKSDNIEENVSNMCVEAMKNRNKEIKEIKSSSIKICGKKDTFVCGVSAIIMW